MTSFGLSTLSLHGHDSKGSSETFDLRSVSRGRLVERSDYGLCARPGLRKFVVFTPQFRDPQVHHTRPVP